MKTAVVLALWLVAAWRLAAIRVQRQRPLWAAFTSVAVACTIARPAVKRIVIEPLGITNLATLLQHAVGIAGSTFVLIFVIAMARPAALARGRWPLYGIAAASIVLLATLFTLTPRPEEVHNFFEANLGQPTGTAYCMVFLGYLAVAMSISSWLFWSYSRHAAGAPLRTGLRLLGAGTAFGALYTLWRIAHMATRLAGTEFVTDDDTTQTIADLVEYLAILLIVLGNSVPAAGVLWRTVTYRRALRQVEPLWTALTEVVPDVVLNDPVGRSPRLRLHRRLIEIWDVVLVLRAYVPAQTLDAAQTATAGVPTSKRDAYADGLWVRAAWEAKLRGASPVCESVPKVNHMDDEDTDFDAEVRSMLVMAAAYRSPAAAEFARNHQEIPA
ncbi:MAB_1171c family putative transporter [Streptomyces sp. TBY4]|uniref:MAB_1171c family putative transporter n=1 Tax=Streptomyces sp. TBY4 TaxID=2962030 RepID=UPI0027E47A34|nr:MAB_1171c family putative transporter [Streptomyces sp. TBY4]